MASAISDLGETLCNIFYTLYLQLLYILELSSLFFQHMLQLDIDIISGTWVRYELETLKRQSCTE